MQGVGLPRPEDGRMLASNDWSTSSSHRAETSFVLPISAHELYLITRGSSQGGHVRVRQSARRGDEVQVHVRVAYEDPRALARATVCRLHKGGNREGVGIFTPTSGSSRDRLLFDVVLTFPAATGDPLPIRALTVLTSNYAHQVGDVWQSIVFENITLDTSNAPIHVDSMTLTKGRFVSSNGAIAGHFNTSDTLCLHTSNAPIQATASLLATGRGPTQLDMRTSNGTITSSVSLTTASGTGGHFGVSARTTNGAVKLRYDDAPTGVRLDSGVNTSNAPAEVGMHPAYEGMYEVRTSNGQPIVRDGRPVDPTGAGRRRVVQSRNDMAGRVYWAGGGGEGTCVVHTSNARVSLDL